MAVERQLRMDVKVGEMTTNVTPLPKYEWESLYVTMLTRVQSPVRSAERNNR